MAVSLKLVVSSFVCLTVAVTALVAFLPLYFSGVDAVEEAAGTIRDRIITRSAANVDNFFRRSRETVLSVQRTTQYGLVDFDDMFVNDYDGLVQYLYEISAKSNGTINNALVRSLRDFHVIVDLRDTLVVVINQQNSSVLNVDGYVMVGEGITYGFSLGTTVFPFPVPFISPTSRSIVSGAYWTDPLPSWGSVSLQFIAPFFGNQSATPIGEFGVASIPESLDDFLLSIGLRSRSRAMVVNVIIGGSNYTVLANSWGENNTQLIRFDIDTRYGLFKSPSQFGDSLIKRVVSTYGEDRLFGGAGKFSATLGTSESDEAYVDVIPVTDEYGLNVRTLLAMPLVDFLEDFYASRTTVIIVLVVSVVVLVVLAVIFSVLLSRPLDRLGERMYLTASFNDSTDADSISSLKEVAEVQTAYVAMRRELNRMKSYLPQSVLQEDDDELDDRSSSHDGKQKAANPGVTDTGSALSGVSSGSSSKTSSIMKGLNITNAAVAKRITVLAINTVGFHAKIKASLVAGNGGLSVAGKSQSKFIGAVYKAVKANKGVIDFFQGDHVVATFNAVNNIAAHQKRAVFAAEAAHQALKAEGISMKAGISSSMAVTGNMGCEDMKRFCVIGRAYSEATHMMMLCRRHEFCHTLMPAGLSEDISTEVHVQYADVLPGPDSSLVLILSIEREKNDAEENWMYQMNSDEKAAKDPYVASSEIVEQLLDRDTYDDGLQALSEHLNDSMSEKHERAIELAIAITEAGSVDQYIAKQQQLLML